MKTFHHNQLFCSKICKREHYNKTRERDDIAKCYVALSNPSLNEEDRKELKARLLEMLNERDSKIEELKLMTHEELIELVSDD